VTILDAPFEKKIAARVGDNEPLLNIPGLALRDRGYWNVGRPGAMAGVLTPEDCSSIASVLTGIQAPSNRNVHRVEPVEKARRVKRLRSDCDVEPCVIVEVVFDGQIALARGLREPRGRRECEFLPGCNR